MVVPTIVPALESHSSHVSQRVGLAAGRRLAAREGHEIRVEHGVAALFMNRRRRRPVFIALVGPRTVSLSAAGGATLLLALTDVDLLFSTAAADGTDVVDMPGFLSGQLIMRLVEVLELSAALRVLRRLTELHGLLGADGGLTVRQHDLAAIAQTSRATVNAVLRQEERKGTLCLGRGQITIHDLDRIRRRAGVESDVISRPLPLASGRL